MRITNSATRPIENPMTIILYI